jgi:hypothetical protein
MSRIASTVSKMQQNDSDAVIQWNGFLKLANWAENNYTNEVTISNVGGIDAILSAMKKHSSNPEVQQFGCEALIRLAENNKTNQVKISNAGGKVAIESAMRYHSSNAGVIEKAKRALSIIKSSSTTTPTPSGSNLMKEAMDNVDSRPIELPVEFINSCTNNFNKSLKLGEGAFGVAYKGQIENRVFVVKCMLANIAVESDKVEEVREIFKRELQVSLFEVSSIACRFKFLRFSFYCHTVSGIKEVATPQYCKFVWLSFVL